jgi:hypothetical protein
MATKYSAVLPDGTVATRKSDRVYTHVIATTWNGTDWKAASYAGNERLAHDRLNEFSRQQRFYRGQEKLAAPEPYFQDVRIIPVTAK